VLRSSSGVLCAGGKKKGTYRSIDGGVSGGWGGGKKGNELARATVERRPDWKEGGALVQHR